MPIRTSHFGFVHMPKTGGDWITYVLQHELGGQRIEPNHGPYTELVAPEELTLFGSLRDPWSWYVSWYNHCRLREGWSDGLKQYGGGNYRWRDVLHGVTHSSIENTPNSPMVLCPEVTAKDEYLASGVGLYSWTVRHLFGWPLELDAIIDLKHLHTGLEEVTGQKYSAAQYSPRNTHRKQHLTQSERIYADPETYNWVAEADREIIELMGYTQPGIGLHTPVKWF